jgi:predicted GIY-YIG superfamily endonuclease
MYYIYLIQNEQKKIYYGYTNDLKRRLLEHNQIHKGFTNGHKWKLIYCEAYLSESDAKEREIHLKKHGQALRRLKSRIKSSLNL